MVALAAVAALVIAPGPLHRSAYQVLHGLCAQQPTHSFAFGERLLPFDARMTGIYGGVLLTLGWMTARGRLRCWCVPPKAVVALLCAGVGLLAVDGLNSLMLDLQLWHLYRPRNEVRLLTGLGAGIAMATLLIWLLATSVWARGISQPGMRSVRELGQLSLLTTPYLLIVLLQPSWLYLPVTLMLLASAWLTLTMLMLVLAVLISHRDGTVTTHRQLHWPVVGAAILALLVMGGLAGGRFWLERALGLGVMI